MELIPRATKPKLIEKVKPSTCNATEIQRTRATHPKGSHLITSESHTITFGCQHFLLLNNFFHPQGGEGEHHHHCVGKPALGLTQMIESCSIF